MNLLETLTRNPGRLVRKLRSLELERASLKEGCLSLQSFKKVVRLRRNTASEFLSLG